MRLLIGGTDVTQLAVQISTSGSSSECARTLSASVVQSPTDPNIPAVTIKNGDAVQFDADGHSFFGTVVSFSRSTASSTVDITAKDGGVRVKNNKISYKIKNQSPETAAALLCREYGVPAGSFASTGYRFSRNYIGVSLYDAIMTGYSLAAAENGKKYYLHFSDVALCVSERGTEVAACIAARENLMEAAYSESIENMVNQVDIYNNDGKLIQTVTGDLSFGVIGREYMTLSDNEDAVAGAEKTIRDKGVNRKGTVQSFGNSLCVTGRAVLIQESFTGLYGFFYIDFDTHTWKNGVYTNKLVLAWENTMTEKEAGELLK